MGEEPDGQVNALIIDSSFVSNHVSNSPNSLDSKSFDFITDGFYMNRYSPLFDIDVFPPYGRVDFFFGYYISSIRDEKDKNFKFLFCYMNPRASLVNRSCRWVDDHSIYYGFFHSTFFCLSTSQNRGDTCNELSDVERFYNEIIRSFCEPSNLVRDFLACCNHDNRRLNTLVPENSAHINTFDIGEYPIQDDDIEVFLKGMQKSRLACITYCNVHFLQEKLYFNHSGERVLIFNNQDVHYSAFFSRDQNRKPKFSVL